MATAMIVDRCDRCGLLFPHTQPSQIGRAFCEPCRDALWRDEQGARADHSTD
jgi:hypothetical protein